MRSTAIPPTVLRPTTMPRSGRRCRTCAPYTVYHADIAAAGPGAAVRIRFADPRAALARWLLHWCDGRLMDPRGGERTAGTPRQLDDVMPYCIVIRSVLPSTVEEAPSMKPVRQTISIPPEFDEAIRRIWGGLIAEGHRVTYSAVISAILLGAFEQLDHGYADETWAKIRGFLSDQEVIDSLNADDWFRQYRKYVRNSEFSAGDEDAPPQQISG